MFEKVYMFVFCLVEKFAISIAIRRPIRVTKSAVSFKVAGIVIICVFIGAV